jgi:GntR family transcriptional regulator
MKLNDINRNSGLNLHDQVAGAIRQAIANGEVNTGERLPPAVDLAAILGVNKNTVIRALHLLREEGVLDFTRGRGVRVVGTPDETRLHAKISELVELGSQLGYDRPALANLLLNE